MNNRELDLFSSGMAGVLTANFIIILGTEINHSVCRAKKANLPQSIVPPLPPPSLFQIS